MYSVKLIGFVLRRKQLRLTDRPAVYYIKDYSFNFVSLAASTLEYTQKIKPECDFKAFLPETMPGVQVVPCVLLCPKLRKGNCVSLQERDGTLRELFDGDDAGGARFFTVSGLTDEHLNKPE